MFSNQYIDDREDKIIIFGEKPAADLEGGVRGVRGVRPP